MKRKKTSKTALYGMLVALAFLFSYIESLLPLSIGIPGVKLGLANLVTLTAIYTVGPFPAFWIMLVRIVLNGFTFGSLSMMIYSLAGGLLSFLVMYICKEKAGLSAVGVSVAGGVSHNLGQLIVAVLVVSNSKLFYYFPALLLAGVIAGILIGIIGGLVIRRIPKSVYGGKE